ncbi:hypothetical protein ABMA28_013072 [Loxostege sticticalis]|uniref:C2H2-type domain-containing protein n=1 Tax=Loxostege sticticalis TaxID=481309 RepID=A0ABD0S5T2_LOXSC
MPKIGVLKKAEQKKQCMNSAIDFIHSTNICPFQFISGRFNCIYCFTRYSTISELEEHVEQEHKGITEKDTAKAIHALGRYKYDPVKVNVLNFICKLCDEDLRKFEDLKQHLIVKHNKRTLVDNDGILPYMMLYADFSCVLCEEKFVSYYKLTKHVNSHYPTFMCDHCGAGFASKARLIGHRIYHDSGLTYPCEECPKVFKNLASKSKHVNKMHKNKTQIFKCPFCEETFKSHYRREKHQQSVHGKQKKKYDVKCKFCHKLFSDIAACKQHENLSHLLAQQYTCDICGFKTIYKDTMRHHIMYTHSTEKNFKCEVCKKSYARRKTLVQHMKKHTNDKKFVCPYCAKAFVQNGNSVDEPKGAVLKKSEQKKQRIISAIAFIHSTNICPFQIFCKRFNCIYCSTRYSTILELEEHVEQEHKGVTEKDTAKAIHALGRYKYDPVKVNVLNFICKLCDEDLRKFEDLKQHLIVKHNKRTLVDNDGILPYMMLYDEFSCVLCEEKFDKYHKLTKHVNSHYPRFMCDHCGDGFATKSRLTAHIIYHDSGTYPCEECSKVFKNMASKRTHVNTMHKNKTQSFKCPFCKETFKSNYQREKHQQSVHGKQKKKYDVKCKFCHKLYSDIAACKQHEKLYHLLAQQYTCDICGFKTIYKGTIRHHIMYTHSTQKNFKCNVCKNSYASRKSLVQHMKIHTNDKRYVCQYCAKAFVQNVSLKTHVQTQHERDTLGKKS